MKAWAEDHPKAKLMERKRAAILLAARDAFLRGGYEGSSMEAIAHAAGVSIMTLYRHAENKDDLFDAVIRQSCGHSREHYAAQHSEQPLPHLLTAVAVKFQDKLHASETASLLRAVMIEANRFPDLASTAYQGFIAAWIENLTHILSSHKDCAGIKPQTVQKLVERFIDQLVGTDILRVLLGLKAMSPADRNQRAEEATEWIVRELKKPQATKPARQ